MPTFKSLHHPQTVKLLYLGHSGTGKTGSIAALAAMGFNIRIADLDNGIHILEHYLTNPNSIYTKAHPKGLWTEEQAKTVLDRVSYIQCAESYQIQGTQAVPKAQAWRKVNQSLNNWNDGENKYGNVGSWTSNDILVIDGLSRLSEAAMNFQLSLNGRIMAGPQVGSGRDNDYTAAYKLITDFLDLLKCDEVKCHVIMVCHIQFMEDTSAPQTGARRDAKGFPQTIGRLISPKVGQYFNHSLLAKSLGNAPTVRRTIVTNNDDNIELKTVAPLSVPREYPLETGLAEYFRDIKVKPKEEQPQTQLPLEPKHATEREKLNA